MRRFLLVISISVVMLSCKQQPASAVIFATGDGEIINFAKAELTKFSEQAGAFSFSENENAKWQFSLKVDETMEPYSFSYKSETKDGKNYVTLKGAEPASLLHSVYSFLEQGGYLFEITGAVLPKGFSIKNLKNTEEEIKPVVKKRGIRQHINFPMDISSYTLEDAKAYVQNLARMRFNFIVFHSYPGLWHEEPGSELFEYAGNYFYGHRHDIPENQYVKDNITSNTKTFCIPEIEADFDNKATRSKKSIEWLGALMNEAKRCGLTVQLSFEPRRSGTDIELTKKMAYSIAEQYPMIDFLEIITEEIGGWGPGATSEQTRETLASHFGTEVLKDTVVTAPIRDQQSDLAKIFGQLGHNIKVVKALENDKNRSFPPLKIGIYCSVSEYNSSLYHLARTYAPDNEITVLPGHHSQRVYEYTPQFIRNSEDWDHTMLYSWIEFDGMMYTQQNGIDGIRGIVDYAAENAPNNRVNAILFNHWRTAENHITARYAAEATLYGAIPDTKFYKNYADKLGIGAPEVFANVMQLIDKKDWEITIQYPNMGFCWVGAWRDGGPLGKYDTLSLKEDINEFETIRQQLVISLKDSKTEEANTVIRFLDNRLRCSILYFRAFLKTSELQQFDSDLKSGLNEEQKKQYADVCNQALSIFDQYMALHAEMMPDRGSEGTLISIYHTPIKGLKILRERNGGVKMGEEFSTDSPVDAPPLPILE
jgi:hypothetical protein